MFTKIEKTPFEIEENFAPLRAALEKLQKKVNQLSSEASSTTTNIKKTILITILQQCKTFIQEYNASCKKPGAGSCLLSIKANLCVDLFLMFLRMEEKDLEILNTDRHLLTKGAKHATYATSVVGGAIAGGTLGGPLGLLGGIAVGYKVGQVGSSKYTESFNILIELIKSVKPCLEQDLKAYGLTLDGDCEPEIIWDDAPLSPLSWKPTLSLSVMPTAVRCKFLLHEEKVEVDVTPYLKGTELWNINLSKINLQPIQKFEILLKLACYRALHTKFINDELLKASSTETSSSSVVSSTSP